MIKNINAIKVLFLGETNVGKTCLISRIDSGEMGSGIASIGFNVIRKNIEVNGKNYECKIFDPAGVRRFLSKPRKYIANSDIVVLVYDITDEQSFLELQYWIDQAIEKNGKDIYFILVGNKSDLIDKEVVKEETAKKFAEIIKSKFTLASAKDNYLQFKEFLENAIKDYIINYMKNKN